MRPSDAPTRVVPGEEGSSSEFRSAWSEAPPADPFQDPLIGTTLNRTFALTRLIGEGGMGRVYEATHTRIKNKRYAIKVLHPELAHSAEVRARFQREAEAAACLSHPNAVSIYDVALTPQGLPYLVCEYLDGVELAKVLKERGPLPLPAARHIVLQVCDVLAEAHESGVIHRDIKPQNVFLVGQELDRIDELPLAKVLDFGLSRFLDGSSSELTKTGMILGPPAYMAPEQARGDRVDERVDIYGVGALLYAVTTGRSPFRGDTPQGVLLAVIGAEPERPSALNPQVPPDLEFVIQRAMAKDPKDRYPDMRSMSRSLASVEMEAPARTSSGDAGLGAGLARAREMVAAGTSRGRLVLYATLLVGIGVLSLAALLSACAALVFGEWPLTRVETLLVAFGVMGTLLSPAYFLVQRVRREIWHNTARVVQAEAFLRRLLFTTGLGVAAASLLLASFEHVVTPMLHGAATSSVSPFMSPRWVVVLFGVAAGVAGFETWRMRASRAEGQQVDGERGLGWASSAIAVGLLAAGVFLLSSLGAPEVPTEVVAAAEASIPVEIAPEGSEPAESDEVTPDATSEAVGLVLPGPSSTAVATPEPVSTATKTELRGAVSQGTEALAALLERHPEDPAVLRALAIQYASRSATLRLALSTFQRLFNVSPSSVSDTEVRQLVLQMTEIPAAQRKAFELLALGMGTEGPDQLFRIALSKPKQKDEALRYLAKANAAHRFSEALSVAYDLQFSSSCAARLPLLPRAREFGDERSRRVLSALSVAKRTGCGRKGKEACPPTCPQEAAEFERASQAITDRMAKP